jgi:hypothetical protein
MADQPIQRIVDPAQQAPQHYTPPSTRDLRSQSVHRLQVGLFGLSAMLLLVGLANIIMDRAMLSDGKDTATEEVIAVDAEPKKPASDPLADIGVQPVVEATPEEETQGDEAADPLGTE